MGTGDVPPGSDKIIAAPPSGAGAPPTEPGSAATAAAPASAGIQSGEPGSIPLPPMPTRPAFVPAQVARRIGILEGILLLQLLLFAFLVASFPAGNSDFFQRLATGRLIAGGEFGFGSDPFTFTAQGIWVNHGWLFDVVSYFVYRTGAFGGTILVVFKALLVVLLAWLMLQAGSRPGQRRWVPAVITLLAILAASPRFQLQPSVPSFVLMALTLYLLVRVGPGSRRIWFLPLVCLLWVNIDEWFFLGPLTITLFLLGAWLQQILGGDTAEPTAAAARESGASGDLKVLGLVFLASLGACLINPYHLHAFTLPVVLDPRVIGSAAAKDNYFQTMFYSPLTANYFQPHTYLSAAGVAWFPLVLLGIVSFVVTFPPGRAGAASQPGTSRQPLATGWQWWRVLVWLVFFGLSAWKVLAIPYFAIVAAPITALNFLDFARRVWGADLLLDPGMRRWAISGRAFSIVVVLFASAASIPGWLGAQPYHTHFIGWNVAVDEGLKGAATQIVQWHQEGKLHGDEHWFNTSPSALHYLSWFAADSRGRPLARGFLDHRLSLYLGTMDDYEKARQALEGTLQLNREQRDESVLAWRKVMTDDKVRFVLFQLPSFHFSATNPTLWRMYSDPDEFEPRFSEGGTAIFAWREPPKGPYLDRHTRPGDHEIDYDALAFGPNAVRAPDDSGRETEPRSWWEDIVIPDVPSTVAAGTAWQHLTRFKAMSFRYSATSAREWQSMYESGLIALGSGPGGPVVNGALIPLRLCWFYRASLGLPLESPTVWDEVANMLQNRHVQQQDYGPVASLYLAIRAARQAIREQPEDPSPYFTLAEAYQLLHGRTRERLMTANRQMPLVDLIRRTQQVAALQSILDLNPAPEIAQRANLMLAEVFGQPEFIQPNQPDYPYFESKVRCLRDAQRHLKALERSPNRLSREAANMLKERLDNQIKEDAKQLKQRLNRYEVTTVARPLLQKIGTALQMGLTEKALELFKSAKAGDLTDKQSREQVGFRLWVQLLLNLGQIRDARTLMTSARVEGEMDRGAFGRIANGLPAYGTLSFVVNAAAGDYEAADKAIDELLSDVDTQAHLDFPIVMAQRDLINFPDGTQKNQSLGYWTGLMVGDILLRYAPQAAGMPWQILPQIPMRLHAPPGGKITTRWHARRGAAGPCGARSPTGGESIRQHPHYPRNG